MWRNRRLWILGTVLLIGTVAVMLPPGATAESNFRILHTFTGGKDGGFPYGDLIFDASGNLYGTTAFGGAANEGTVFKLAPNQDGSWSESVLYSFCSMMRCPDGANPAAALIFDQGGSLYGTTLEGGAGGWGTVFKLTPNSNGKWTESVLHSFCSLTDCDDGVYPSASLIFDQAGNLYGTTWLGGKYDSGVVFELTPSGGTWVETVLYAFTGGADGSDPTSNVIFDTAGNLYGTTVSGGVTSCNSGCGVVFELTTSLDGGWKETVLYRFTGGTDGSDPAGGLILDQAGNLFGTTFYGGDKNFGTVFGLTPNNDGKWTESVLHQFTGGQDGGAPDAGLILDQAGNLYGTTAWGGNLNDCYEGCGVVFKLTPKSGGAWNETVLHRFLNHPGADPYAGVIFDTAGNLYGTTYGYNHLTFGSVFKITP